jgi:hypothetical protein
MDGRNEKCTKILVEKREGKRIVGRPRRRWKDYIRLDRMEIEWEDVDGMKLPQDRTSGRPL